MRHVHSRWLAAAAISLVAFAPAQAQYPNKPVRLILPFPPGGAVDTLGRIMHPSVPAKSVKELIALAKARPGQLDFASSGSGGSPHLAGALFNNLAGTRMNHIPYKGGGPAVIALVAGECAVGFATAPSVIHHVKSGRLRGLAVTSAQRAPLVPDLPTVSEAGIPGYEAGAWQGLLRRNARWLLRPTRAGARF